jgi:dTDP-glucose pyrophosphorylase
MKALILAGGRGKRLDGLMVKSNKCMIKIKGKHLLEYNLENAVKGGLDEIIIVIGYRGEDIVDTFGYKYNRTKIQYVFQEEPIGLVHAIECAKEALEGEDFLLMLGDEILQRPRHSEMIEEYKSKSEIFGLCGVLWVNDRNLIKKTYTIFQDDNNSIHKLIEKPKKPFNNFQGTGQCVFNNKILEYIDITPINPQRKAKELPGLIQTAIDNGKIIKSFNICHKYSNINTKEDIIMAEGFDL